MGIILEQPNVKDYPKMSLLIILMFGTGQKLTMSSDLQQKSTLIFKETK